MTAVYNGTFTYFVRVTDAAGNTTQSAQTALTVNIAETQAPAKPSFVLSKTSFVTGEDLTITPSTISDNVAVTRVELIARIDASDVVLETATASPWTLTETLVCPSVAAVGPALAEAPVSSSIERELKVVAYDAAGNSTASDPQTVTIRCILKK
jgi:hypothetical protein